MYLITIQKISKVNFILFNYSKQLLSIDEQLPLKWIDIKVNIPLQNDT